MTANTQAQTTVISQRREPGCLIQALWFLFVGWWLGGAATTVAWLLNNTIIGLPIGMAILNNIPKFLALQEPQKNLRVVAGQDGSTRMVEVEPRQHNFFIRALFFLLIGWWWSGIWMGVAYILCMTIILIPIGLEMYRQTPKMTTLRRY